jgi:hypothetical protein
MMVAAIVYMLCALMSVLCAVLLLAKYRASKARLLFWSALCFSCLAVNNILLFVDIVVVPHVDLWFVRTVPALIGIGLMLWGFIWDTE